MSALPRIARISLLVLVALVPASLAEGRAVPGAPSCPMTPADSFWHADVSALPVHAQSAPWISSIGATAGLKADFGAGQWNGGPIGIPYTTVPGTQPRVPVSFGYADESDPGPYPVPPNAPIEGGSSSSGDRHVLVVDRDACRLWELYSAYPQNGGASWTAGSGATWSLTSNAMRPLGWTSGDAAGLPILPGLVRYDEVAAGEIDHVVRFTAPRTAGAYVWPASHKAQTGGASDPPMGAWLRLKASYDISGYSAHNQVILRALKKHGMVLADNGSSLFMSGSPDPGWNDSDLNALRAVPGSAFEAVDVSSLKVSSTSYAVSGGAPPPPPPPPPPTELVANPGFETGLGGWSAGNNRTTLVRTCLAAHTGSCSANLGRQKNTGDVVLDDSPETVGSTVAGATYRAAAWVLAPAGRTVRLRVRELNGSTVVRSSVTTAIADGSWHQLAVATTAASGGTRLSVEVVASLARGSSAYTDDVSLIRN
jgi:Carbohydrate binding domain